MSVAEVNLLASIGAIFLASVLTYLFSRFGKAADARGAAEAALMGLGPAIIQEQNKRIAQASAQIEALWKRDEECRRELRASAERIYILERKVGP